MSLVFVSIPVSSCPIAHLHQDPNDEAGSEVEIAGLDCHSAGSDDLASEAGTYTGSRIMK